MGASFGLREPILTRLGSQVAGTVIALAAIAVSPGSAGAQVIPDATLNTESSTITSDTLVQGTLADLIEGGAIRGGNLFHSFLEFNINEGQRVYFANPEGIESILSRVTGNNPSNIFGTLGVNGTADLFLINPNGIVFGENAVLDVGGSLTATTASGVQFGDAGQFSAVEPDIPAATLNIDPSAYFFSAFQPGTIVNRSVRSDLIDGTASGLRVPNGENLTLLGGNIAVEGGNLRANGGRIQLGAVESNGVITLNGDGILRFPEEMLRGNIEIRDQASILSIAENGGGINLIGKDISIINNNVVGIGILGDPDNNDGQAGDLVIQATGDVRMDNQNLVTNQVIRSGFGKAGDIRITATNFEVTNETELIAATFGEGDSGDLYVDAENRITLDNGGFIFNFVIAGAEGQTGNINLTADLLEIFNGSRINASTFGQGNAGNVNIQVESLQVINDGQIASTTRSNGDSGNISIKAQDEILLSNSLIITEVVEGLGNGDGGDINIETKILEVIDGSAILADTENIGDAGNINITASESMTLAGEGSGFLNPDSITPSQISSTVERGAVGEGGNIVINTNNFFMLDDTFISASTAGQGNAGDIIIRAANETILSNALIITEVVEDSGNGDAGNINIETRVLELLNGSALLADTENLGNAGNLNITAFEKITLAGQGPGANDPSQIVPSQITTTVDPRAVGSGGDLTINTGVLSITDSGFIRTSTFGQGIAGNMIINADVINLDNGAEISAFTRSSEDAGTISIFAREAIIVRGQDDSSPSQITSASLGDATGNGGAVFIASPMVLLINGGIISAVSEATGIAGRIDLATDRLEISDGSIETNAAQASGGDISVNASRSNPRGIVVLSGDGDITTDSFGNGGNIMLISIVIAFEDSDILARSADARGGNITLGPFFSSTLPIGAEPSPENNGRVDVSADGQLESGVITTPDTDIVQNSLSQLTDLNIDPTSLVAGSCIARITNNQGSFVVTGSGGLPIRPGDSDPSAYPTGEVQAIPDTTEVVWQPGDPIVEPTGVYELSSGRLVLSRECDESYEPFALH